MYDNPFPCNPVIPNEIFNNLNRIFGNYVWIFDIFKIKFLIE